MKKLIISIGSLLIMAFVVILFINATESKKDKTKAKTEVTKGETPVSCPATCYHSTAAGTATGDTEKCKEMKNAQKDSKCDPSTCPMHMESQTQKGQMCGSASCNGTIKTETADSK